VKIKLTDYDKGFRDAVNVRFAAAEGIYLAGINIEAQDREFAFTEKERERKADIAHSHNPNFGCTRFNSGAQIFCVRF